MRYCSASGCERRHHANGFCNRHNSQIKKYGKIKNRTTRDRNLFIKKDTYYLISLFDIECNHVGYTKIDLDDYEKTHKIKWHLNAQGYVVNKKIGRLHNFIIGRDTGDKGHVTDHINKDKLDNRKLNLRIATHSLSAYNQRIRIDNSSGVTGVVWDKLANMYKCRIYKNNKCFYLGHFKNKLDAIKARKEAENKYYGEFINA